jgi:multiple sugar transport system permease protein
VKKKATIQTRRNSLTAFLFLLPNLIGFLAFTVIPVIMSLVMSFFNWPIVGKKEFIGFTNYSNLFINDMLFKKIMVNTLFYVIGYLACNLMIALMLALWLTGNIKKNNFYRSVFFIPQVIPLVATTMLWRWMFLPEYGLINNVLEIFGFQNINWFGNPSTAMTGIVIMSLWQGFGYNMIIFIAGLNNVPMTLKEAAKIDGCGSVRTFFYVTLPMLSPSIFFTVVMTTISAFQIFDQTFIATNGGPNYSTTTVVMYIYQNAFMFQKMGYASAIAWVLFAIIFVVTLVQMKMQDKWVVYE